MWVLLGWWIYVLFCGVVIVLDGLVRVGGSGDCERRC